MGVNSYMQPAVGPQGLKPFEVPFKELAIGIAGKQKAQDDSEEQAMGLADPYIKTVASTDAHKQILKDKVNDLHNWYDTLVTKYKGNLSDAGDEIRRKAREVASDLNSGDLATIQNTTDQIKLHQKAYAEEAAKPLFDARYDAQFGATAKLNAVKSLTKQNARDANGNLIGYSFNGVSPLVDQEAEITKMGEGLQASGLQQGFFDPIKGYDNTKALKAITPDMIATTVENGKGTLSPAFQDKLNNIFSPTNDPNRNQLYAGEATKFLEKANPVYKIKNGQIAYNNGVRVIDQEATSKQAQTILQQSLDKLDPAHQNMQLAEWAKNNHLANGLMKKVFNQDEYGNKINYEYIKGQQEVQPETPTTQQSAAINQEGAIDNLPEFKEFDANGNLKEAHGEEIMTTTSNPYSPGGTSVGTGTYKAPNQEQLAQQQQRKIEILSKAKQLGIPDEYTDMQKTAIIRNAFNHRKAEYLTIQNFSTEGAKTQTEKLIGHKDLQNRQIHIIEDNKFSKVENGLTGLAKKLGYSDAADVNFKKALADANAIGRYPRGAPYPGATTVNIVNNRGQLVEMSVEPDKEIANFYNALDAIHKIDNTLSPGSVTLPDPKTKEIYTLTTTPSINKYTGQAEFEYKLFNSKGKLLGKPTLTDLENTSYEALSKSGYVGSFTTNTKKKSQPNE